MSSYSWTRNFRNMLLTYVEDSGGYTRDFGYDAYGKPADTKHRYGLLGNIYVQSSNTAGRME
jgi:hypothetical protein